MTQPVPNRIEIVRSLRTAEILRELHTVSDVDSSPLAQHHTLGIKHNQASPGDHSQDAWTKITTGNWLGYSSIFALKVGGAALPTSQYTVDARYLQIDKLVFFQVGVTMNAGFTYGGLTGALSVGLPVLPANRTQQCNAWISRSAVDILAVCRVTNTTDAQLRITGHQATTTDYPAWASGDKIECGGSYQAA